MIWHLTTNWITGHWLIAAIASVAALLFFVPGVGLPLLRALFTTRPGLVATTLALALGLGNWYGADRYASGVHDTQAAAQTKVDAANLKASQANRDRDTALNGVFNSTQLAYERGRKDENAAVSGVLGDVASGRYVLRDHFRCPAIRSAPAPPADPRAAASAEPAAGGVSGADVQFLIRFAGDADGVSNDLRLCEATLEAEREVK